MMSNFQLHIEYESQGFPRSSGITNGAGTLITSWDELLWAAVTVGRPNRQYVFRHGDVSIYEAIFRWSLIRMALEQRGPRSHWLYRTAAARTLDPSEKGAVSYFIGMTLCKLFSAKLLGAPWVMHLDVYRPQLDTVLAGRSRPDLIGQILDSNDWVAFESKGRISVPSNYDKNRAKEQALRLISIDSSPPRFHIGAISYFWKDVFRFFWRDPEPEPDKIKNPIKITLKDDDWRYYYWPVYDLIRQHSRNNIHANTEMPLLPIEGVDIQVGLHSNVFSLLAREKWIETKHWCTENAEELMAAEYEADGIRIIAGETWLKPLDEKLL